MVVQRGERRFVAVADEDTVEGLSEGKGREGGEGRWPTIATMRTLDRPHTKAPPDKRASRTSGKTELDRNVVEGRDPYLARRRIDQMEPRR